jgi:hypothetical protein
MQRQTKQREAIAACFASAGRPLSPHEVHALACEVQPSLGIATVYRALNAFVEDGLLVRVPIAEPPDTSWPLSVTTITFTARNAIAPFLSREALSPPRF